MFPDWLWSLIPPQHAEPLRQELYALVESGLLVEQKDLLASSLMQRSALERPESITSVCMPTRNRPEISSALFIVTRIVLDSTSVSLDT